MQVHVQAHGVAKRARGATFVSYITRWRRGCRGSVGTRFVVMYSVAGAVRLLVTFLKLPRDNFLRRIRQSSHGRDLDSEQRRARAQADRQCCYLYDGLKAVWLHAASIMRRNTSELLSDNAGDHRLGTIDSVGPATVARAPCAGAPLVVDIAESEAAAPAPARADAGAIHLIV
ncbi:hypothetical protein EVAR_44488_1 [Eumeta japonica]|uniref:Uncharacterized protein n=1 Tax=Eumeta variegata TaxID=151549 RepID=A0A4C1WLZ4_EUMVA|nr:hypothetical protein EVAR_44488_1 [Eumeta japonica]